MAPNTPAPGTPDTKAPHRLFVGGLTKPVAPDQLRARFTPFGTVLAVDIPQPASQTPDVPRGFAHVTLETNRAGLKRCMSTYNGTKWAGMVLKIDEAKPSYLDRLKEEWKEAEKGVVEKPKKRKRKRRDAMVANDMTLITDAMAPLPLGWSRTRYDRAILTPIHLRDPATRKVRIVDMESYKSALVKFGKKTEVTEKSVADLTWPTWDGVEDDEDEVEGEKSGPAPRLPAPATVSSPSETKEDVHMPESTVPDVKPVVAPAKAPKAAENTKPQEAPAKPAEKAKKPAEPPKKLAEPPKPKPAQATQPEDRIAKALREEKRKSLSLLMAVLAGEDEDETKEAKDENMGGVVSFLDDDFETAPKHAPVRARPFALESSSDEDSGDDGEQSDHNSEPKVEDSKPVEAENAEMAEADEPESESTGSSFEGAEESAESESERQKNDALVQSVSDSDDESASGVEESSAKGSEPVEETQQGESSSQETNQPDQRVQPQQPDQPEQQAEYKVNTDLRALIFAPSSSSAATKPGVAGLFGGGIRTKFKLTTALGLEDSEDEGEEDDAQKAEPEMARETRETPIPRDSIPIASSRGAKPLFAHFGHPTLDFRLFYPLPPDAVPFHRHESEEEVVKRWEETRKELTEGYKKRHKQAVRRRRKMGLGVELD